MSNEKDPFENGLTRGGKSVPPPGFEPEGMSFVTPREVIMGRMGGGAMPISAGRMPPQALEMEQAVIGALLLERDALSKIKDALRPEMLYKEGHKVIYEAICELASLHEPVDLLTVKDHLSKNGKFEVAGGIYYLTELTSKVASAANIEYHARVIAQKYLLRELIKMGDGIVQAGYDNTTDVSTLLDSIEASVKELASSRGNTGSGVDFSDAVEQAEKTLEAIAKGEIKLVKGPRHLGDLPLLPGEVFTIAGDSAVGKTGILLNWFQEAAEDGHRCILFSLEMTAEAIAMREMAFKVGVDGWTMRSGGLSKDHWTSWQGLKNIKGLKIYTSNGTISDMRAKVAAYRRSTGWKGPILVGIDYFQLMTGPGNQTREILDSIARELKEWAVADDLVTAPLTQVNRLWITTKEKKPTAHNIRECDALRHASDFVVVYHRPETVGVFTDDNGQSTRGMGTCGLYKSRIGQPGSTEVFLESEATLHFHKGRWMGHSEFRTATAYHGTSVFPEKAAEPWKSSDTIRDAEIEDFLSLTDPKKNT